MNPLRGLAFDADAVARYASIIEGPLLLVGHSYGRCGPSLRPCLQSKTSRGGFLGAAFALDEGESCASVQEPFPPSLAASVTTPTPYDAPGAAGGPDLFINIPDFQQAFCADLPDALADTMAVSQRPLSAAAISEKATVAGWKGLPSWYMVSEKDNAIPPDAERFMAKRMDAVTESVDGSHAAFIARPDVAAGFILKAVAAA